MSTPPSSDVRDRLLTELHAALHADGNVAAALETGYAAEGHIDVWSEIELQAIVQDGAEKSTIRTVERAIERVVSIASHMPTCAPLPHPPPLPWLDVEPCPRNVYRLDDFGLHILVDMEVVPRGASERLAEIVRHARYKIWFDRQDLLGAHRNDTRALRERLRRVIGRIRQRHEMLAALPKHEVRRGNAVDAMHVFRELLLRPLVTLLRIQHCPHRFDGDMRYLRIDVPAAPFRLVKTLSYVASLDDLARKVDQATQEVDRLLNEIDVDKLDMSSRPINRTGRGR